MVIQSPTRVNPLRLTRLSAKSATSHRLTSPPVGVRSAYLGFFDPHMDPNNDTEPTEDTKDFFGRLLNAIEGFFKIGQGRTEADIIVPYQNELMAKLGTITDQFRIGTNPSLYDLQRMLVQVKQYGAYWIKYVSDPRFFDGRASAQSCDTVMPYINGTCGYGVKQWNAAGLLYPTQFNCLTWGDGQYGGPGTDGMIGALSRAIVDAGGTPPNPDLPPADVPIPPISSLGLSTPMLLGIGVVALFLFSRK